MLPVPTVTKCPPDASIPTIVLSGTLCQVLRLKEGGGATEAHNRAKSLSRPPRPVQLFATHLPPSAVR